MEWLRYGAQHYPDRICINEYTYNDIYGGVLHVASELIHLGNFFIICVQTDSNSAAFTSPPV